MDMGGPVHLYPMTGLKRIKEGGAEWIWVNRNKENKGGGRGVYGWTGLKRMKEGGEEWIWVDRIKENKGGGRGVDMGGIKRIKEGGEEDIKENKGGSTHIHSSPPSFIFFNSCSPIWPWVDRIKEN